MLLLLLDNVTNSIHFSFDQTKVEKCWVQVGEMVDSFGVVIAQEKSTKHESSKTYMSR